MAGLSTAVIGCLVAHRIDNGLNRPIGLANALRRQAEVPTFHPAVELASAAFQARTLSREQDARFVQNAAPAFDVTLAPGPEEHGARWFLDIVQTTEQARPDRPWSGLDCTVRGRVLVDAQPAGPFVRLDFNGPRASDRAIYSLCSGRSTHNGGWMQLELTGRTLSPGAVVTLELEVTVSDMRQPGPPAPTATILSSHTVVVPGPSPAPPQ